jgi:hypothetical protein
MQWNNLSKKIKRIYEHRNKRRYERKSVSFIEAQPGYNADEVEEITIHYKNNIWGILYGKNIEVGISGFGDSPETAFHDFISKWKAFKGFEWIKRTKTLSTMSF